MAISFMPGSWVGLKALATVNGKGSSEETWEKRLPDLSGTGGWV